jgi:EpsD family peptidyl-prolyl cis-trans isomerase
MKLWVGVALAVAGVGALAGCTGHKTPTGQVVATVGDREITLREVRAELGAFNSADPKALKAAEATALRNIIGRDILAAEARKEGLDKTPDFAVQKERMLDSLLVQTLQQKIASEIPPITKEEAQRFIAANPDIFAQRKVFVLDQLQMPRPTDPTLIKALEPLKTFEQIQALLTERKVPFKRVNAVLDAVGADPRLIAAVIKVAPGDLFVLPTNQIVTVNQVKETKVVPFTGDQAVRYAQQLLIRQRTQEAIQKRFQDLFQAQGKNIKFSKDFAPLTGPLAGKGAPPAAVAPAAPAAAAPPEAAASGAGG